MYEMTKLDDDNNDADGADGIELDSITQIQRHPWVGVFVYVYDSGHGYTRTDIKDRGEHMNKPELKEDVGESSKYETGKLPKTGLRIRHFGCKRTNRKSMVPKCLQYWPTTA